MIWVKETGVMIPFRLLAFSLLGFVMLLATGCAGKTGTVQPQGLSDARPATDQTPAPAPPSPPVAPSDEPLDPFARADEGAGEEYDPWEPMNTSIFEFNRQVDRFVLKPVAKGYNFITPDLVQVGVSNFFYNIRFAPRFLNNVFQGKVKGAGIELGRFLINSTVGIAGFFDVAKKIDLVTPEEDLGQTLGFYGVKPGPYLVLPFMPPFTVRDLVGYVGDVFLNPINWMVVPIIEVDGVPSVIEHKNRMTTSIIQT
ncbi:MAG: MlaA family lipoprotein, partial [Nitrospiraceae bacterium]